jgi:hypothetical protein
MKYVPTLSRLLLLGGLVYLGFYGFGLVMGVFAPGEMIGFTIVAALIVVAYAVHAIRLNRRAEDPAERAAIMRELHDQQERRGF